MAERNHFENISMVDGNIKVNINLSEYGANFEDAQAWLGEQVLQDCRAIMPMQTGSLTQRSHTLNNGRQVAFPGPYARFLYGGLVMVDPDTNSPWARKGAKKVLTDRALRFSRPEAVSHWFDEAKARNGEYWIKKVKEIVNGK